MIYNEFLLRHSDTPSSAEVNAFLARFPDVASQLERQFKFCFGVNAFGKSIENQIKPVENLPNRGTPPTVCRWIADRFEISRRLGGGGFSDVYEAWDHQFNRAIALKIANAQIGIGTNTYLRFEREAESAARLNHAGLVQFYEFGLHDDRPFIVCQLIRGGTIQDKIDNQEYTAQQAATWIWQVCQALDYAHQLGVIHRDVKPANILVDEDNRALLTDFGLASLAEGELTITKQGDLLGTPAYMSPEQALGEKNVGPASDVYSLGAVFYHLLNRKLPFNGTASVVLHQKRNDNPNVHHDFDNQVCLDLKTICLKAMAHDPRSRYLSAAEMGDDLFRYLNHEPIKARPVGVLEKTWRWCCRNPATASTLLVSSLLLLILSIASFIQISGERDRFRAQRDIANQNLFESLVNTAESEIRSKPSGWYDRSIELLTSAADLDVPSKNVSKIRELLIEVLGATTPRFHLDAETNSSEFFANPSSPSKIVSVSSETQAGIFIASYADGSIKVVNNKMLRPLAKLNGPSEVVSSLEVLPDSRAVFGVANKKLWKWSLESAISGKKQGAINAISGERLAFDDVSNIAVSKDGSKFAIAFGNLIRIVQIQSGDLGKIVADVKTNDVGVGCLAFSDDSRELVAGLKDLRFCRWSASNGLLMDIRDTIGDVPHSVDANNSIVVSTDKTSFGITVWKRNGDVSNKKGFPGHVVKVGLMSSYVVYGCDDGTIGVVSSGNPRQRIASTSTGGELTALSVSHDGNSAISGHSDGRLRRWSLRTSEIAKPFPFLHSLVFSKNEFISNDIRVRESSKGQLVQTSIEKGLVRAIDVHQKTNLLVCARDDCLLVVDLATRSVRKVQTQHAPNISHVAISPDGKWIGTADPSGTICVWRFGKVITKPAFSIKTNGVLDIRFSINELIASQSNGISIWKLSNPTNIRVLDSVPQVDGALSVFGSHVAYANARHEIILRKLDGQLHRVLQGHSRQITQLEFSNDGKRIFSLAQDGTFRRWDVDQGNETKRLAIAHRPSRFCRDPLDRFLVVYGNPDSPEDVAKLVDYETGRLIGGFNLTNGPRDIAFDPMGQWLWLGRYGGVLEYDRKSLTTAFQKSRNETDPRIHFDIPFPYRDLVSGGHYFDCWSASISPDGKWFASTGHGQKIVLRSAPEFYIEKILTAHDDVVWGSAFSGDGSMLATGSAREKRGEIIIWETDSWQLQRRIFVAEEVITGLCFHPRLPLLAASSFDGSVWLINYESGELIKQLAPKGSKAMEVVFSPDGKRLAAARTSSGVSIWPVNESAKDPVGDPVKINDPDKDQIWTVQFQNNGNVIAVGTESGLIRLYRISNVEPLVTIRTDSRTIRRIAFSEDDRLMAYAAYISRGGQVWDLKLLRDRLKQSGLDW